MNYWSVPATGGTAWTGLMASAGCEGALGFVIAHELLHSRQWQERTLAEAVLCTLGYMHWSKSHLVHHQRVSGCSLLESHTLRLTLAVAVLCTLGDMSGLHVHTSPCGPPMFPYPQPCP